MKKNEPTGSFGEAVYQGEINGPDWSVVVESYTPKLFYDELDEIPATEYRRIVTKTNSDYRLLPILDYQPPTNIA